MAKLPSRPTRWGEAVAGIQQALSDFNEHLTALRDLREEYEEWRDGLPENLQDSPTAELLNELVDESVGWFDELESAYDTAESALSDVENAELPRGFGRD